MTTPSGQISAQDIKNEFGEVGGTVPLGSYRVQETRGALSLNIGDGVPGSGTISYDNMRNKRLNIVVDYYADNPNLNRAANGANTMNARTRYDQQNERVHVIGGLKSKPSNTAPHRVRIHVNQTIGGAKGGQNVCALRTGNFDANTSLIVDVGSSGKIYGGGGDGGEGGNEGMDSGNDGQAGASALGIDHQGTTVNVASGGLIRCGFGGGGGGGAGRQVDKGEDRRAGGGGGGGGQGYPGGSGGHRGTAAGGADGGDGSAGDLTEAGEGGGGGSRAKQAFGAAGGECGSLGNGSDNGGGAQSAGGGGGAQGSAIRKGSGVSFSLNNSGTINGNTNQTGVS